MGLPLGLTFANKFLNYYEQRWLENCPSDSEPLTDQIFVDDTVVVFKDKNHAFQSFDYINSQHGNTAFIADSESITLSFHILDLLTENI